MVVTAGRGAQAPAGVQRIRIAHELRHVPARHIAAASAQTSTSLAGGLPFKAPSPGGYAGGIRPFCLARCTHFLTWTRPPRVLTGAPAARSRSSAYFAGVLLPRVTASL